MSVLFRRKVYDKLLDWKSNSKGRSALLVEGARRVGKTTIVEEFGRREYSSFLKIDFVNPLPGTIEMFQEYRHDIGLLLSNLSILYKVDLKKRKSLVIFDEVQKYPPARELIKYLVQDGRYDYIETGSLIGIRKNVENIQIPSEEESVQMHPMDFEEWLWANGDQGTSEVIRRSFEERSPLGQSLHAAIMRKYREYMIVGGMPASVSSFISGHDLSESERVKRQIIKLYREDIMKIPDGYAARALSVFNSIPAILSFHRKVFTPGTVEPGTLRKDYDESIVWLTESKIVTACLSNTDPTVAMNLTNDANTQKLYLLDTGLLLTLATDTGDLDVSVLVEFAKSRLSINEGMLFENAVAQALTASGHSLYFNEFYLDGDKKHLYEVDFVKVSGKRIAPIEVKSSQSSRHRSLDLFIEKYHSRIDEVFVVHSKDLHVSEGITYIPIYMSQFL